jgi:hypothetical protein
LIEGLVARELENVNQGAQLVLRISQSMDLLAVKFLPSPRRWPVFSRAD